MTAHTPGQWFTESPEGTLVYSQVDQGAVCQLKFLKGRHGLGGRRDPDEVDANARLIAAAPDLLAALKAALEACKAEPAMLDPKYNLLGIMANGAIAKAEGRAS